MPEISMRVGVERRGMPSNPMGALEVEIRVISLEGGEGILDDKPFVFQKEVSSSSSNAQSRFYSVATVHQISVLPDMEPDNLQAQDEPFWRSSSTGFLSFLSSVEREGFISSVMGSLAELQAAAQEVLSGGSGVEEVEIVEPQAPGPPFVPVPQGEVYIRNVDGRLEWRVSGGDWVDLGDVGETSETTRILLGAFPRGEDISGLRAVRVADDGAGPRVFKASSSSPDGAATGFVIEAGAEGEVVNVWERGPLPGGSGFEPGAAYFLGPVGQFLAAPPDGAAILQKIGLGVTPTIVFGRAGDPILL